MNEFEKWDRLLKQALSSTAEPDEELNQRIINHMRERNTMKHIYRKRIYAGVLAAVFALVMSVTAIAATQFFSPKQVAEHFGEQILAKAFESKNAIQINQTVTAEDYNLVLHGIVSGAGLKDLDASSSNISRKKTYAVVSIARKDGSPMPTTSDPAYGKKPFFISPLVKGLKPWQVNITTMNGGYSEVVLDGVMYRLIECDDVEMFADRGVYLAIIGDSSFYNSAAFDYNENTGEIRPKANYNGISLLFDLPLDKSKADPSRAEAYLKNLLKNPSGKSLNDNQASQAASDEAAKEAKRIEELKNKIPNATIIPESVKKVTIDKQGNLHYEHDGWDVTLPVAELFTDGQTGDSDAVYFSSDGHNDSALQFSRDRNGLITGRIVKLN